MSRYSAELRELISTFGESEAIKWFSNYELSDFLTNAEISTIEERGTWTKEKLAKKILEHYYLSEIGFETPSLFIKKAKVLMQELMEEKLPLIYSASIKYDPLVNVDFTESYQGSNEGIAKSNSSSLGVNSDTPQGQISKNKILRGEYASSTGANEVEDLTNSSGSNNYVKTIRGNSGVSATAQKMIEQYRQNIIAIDKEIIRDVAELFMSCYN